MAQTRKEEFKYTKYEKARMIGSRALQIASGAPFKIKLTKKQLADINFSPLEIAKMEYNEGVIPITVKRPIPDSRPKVGAEQKA
ncbi:MAG: DNA-directed RNA polymerase subunit K [Nanoarchaeota archaeon]|nr:DNA-directed RNA polymerase subunit K [Nanoarchaeota archaeon]